MSAYRSRRRRRRPFSWPREKVNAPYDTRTLVAGLDAEIRVASRPVCVRVLQVNPLEGERLELRVRVDEVHKRGDRVVSLTDVYENGSIQERSEKRWSGVIDAIEPKHSGLVVRIPNEVIPAPGERALIFTNDYLRRVRDWAVELKRLPEPFESLKRGDPPPAGRRLKTVKGLRRAQREALRRAGQPWLLVWGPPGTGKTYTLGTIVARYVSLGRSILALSTTNVAVDLLVLAIDDACRRMGRPLQPGELIRPGVPIHEDLIHAPERRHLLRWTEALDEVAREERRLLRLKKQINLQLHRIPDDDPERPRMLVELGRLSERLQELRQHRNAVLHRLVREAKIIAATCATYFLHEDLRARSYDVTVVDETSMVPAAVACALLADKRDAIIFGGDFRQLPAISLAADTDPCAAIWIGCSLFEAIGAEDRPRRERMLANGTMVLLDEQSRMRQPIAEAISDAFYDGRLRTINEPGRLEADGGWPSDEVLIVDPTTARLPRGTPWTAPGPSKAGGSWTWDRSAHLTRFIVEQAIKVLPEDMTILAGTPFRGQARLLSTLVGALGEGDRVQAGTIHRLQGAEADLVLFDPVQPATWFVTASPQAPRLVNVALSRARRQLIVLAAPEALERNVWLSPLLARGRLWSGPG